MTTRTTHSVVAFAHPVSLPGVDGVLPAGSYAVDTDEEMIDSLNLVAWRRTATLLHVPARGGMQTYTVDPDDLAAAAVRDREISPPRR
jgi:hypothetical protein